MPRFHAVHSRMGWRSAGAAEQTYGCAGGTMCVVTSQHGTSRQLASGHAVPSSLLLLLRRRIRLLLDDVSGGHDPLRRHEPIFILTRSSACFCRL